MNKVEYMGYTFVPYGNIIGKNAETRGQRLVLNADLRTPLLSIADGYNYEEFNKTTRGVADIYYCPETKRHYVPTGVGDGCGLFPINIAKLKKYIKLIEHNPDEEPIYTLEKMKNVLGDDYAFHQTKTVDEVKKILATGEMPENDNDNVPFVLEAGNLDIEMTINYGVGVISENGTEVEPLSIGYFCCVRTNGEWESFEEIPYAVNLDVPDLEAEMFRVLDKFAEKRALSYFAENDHIHDKFPPLPAEDEDELEM
jgi:hypothetical protein